MPVPTHTHTRTHTQTLLTEYSAASVGLKSMPRRWRAMHRSKLPCSLSQVAHARCTYLKGSTNAAGMVKLRKGNAQV